MLVSEIRRRWWFNHCLLMAPETGGGSGAAAEAGSTDGGVENETGEAAAGGDEDDWIPSMEDIAGAMSPEERKNLGKAKKPEKEEEEETTENAENAEEEEETGEETEAETEEETAEEETTEETETEEDTDEELTDAEGKKIALPPAAQAAVNKRIGQIVKQRQEALDRASAAETKVTELTTQLGTAQAAPLRIEPNPEMPLAHVTNAQELQEVHARALAVRDWALRNPDGAEVVTDAKTGTKEFLDKTAVANHLANATRTLEAIPVRRDYLQKEEAFNAEARAAYPKVYQAGTPEAALYQNLRTAMPWLQKFADHDLMICDAIEGMKIRLLKKKQAGNGGKSGEHQVAALTGKTAPRVHAGPVAPKVAPKVPAKTIETSEAEKKVLSGKKHPTSNDVERAVEKRLERLGY